MLRAFLSLALVAASSFTALQAAPAQPRRLDATTARTRPYSMVGQIFFTSGGVDYIGTGTVIKAYSAITAGHNLYDPSGGFSTDVEFRRGAYGDSVLGDKFASRLYLLAGYRAAANTYGSDSVRAFAYDAGGLLFNSPPANGQTAPYTANTALLGNSYSRVCVGYGAEVHSGDYPLYVSPTTAFYKVYGAFWENSSIEFEGGMSGGPVFSRNLQRVQVMTAIIVAGSTGAGGVRVVDQALVSFIANNLR